LRTPIPLMFSTGDRVITPPDDVIPDKIQPQGSYQSFSYALRQMRRGAFVKRDAWAAEIVKLDTILLDESGQNPMPKALIIRDDALTQWRLWMPDFARYVSMTLKQHKDEFSEVPPAPRRVGVASRGRERLARLQDCGRAMRSSREAVRPRTAVRLGLAQVMLQARVAEVVSRS